MVYTKLNLKYNMVNCGSILRVRFRSLIRVRFCLTVRLILRVSFVSF